MRDQGVQISRGNWEIHYNPLEAALVCSHGKSGATLSGILAFRVADSAWRIDASRDAVADRLALVDTNDNVQGYVTFLTEEDRLNLLVLHRTAQSYGGQLALAGTLSLPGTPFPCRTQAPAASDVIQFASGQADSALNDSIFDCESDTAVRLLGGAVALNSTSNASFEVRLTANIHDASCSTLGLIVMQDYYRSRYVPYYAPIDRSRCPSAPTGWMSWNVYFDQAGSRENLDEARIGAEKLKPFGMEFWSIESWQGNSDKLPVSTFHNLNLSCHPGQFPEGMKWLADEIRSLGFRPGIWTAPFGTGNAEFYEEHKNWFLHRADGTPFTNWCGKYLLDPSQPEVREHMRKMHRKMAQEWGYEFFKIDGMSGRSHGYSAHFFERPEVQAAFARSCPNPFELCAETLREGIGPEAVFLACQGHYSGPEARVADASRIGGDIVAPNKASTWHNILSQAKATVNQLFVHGIVFYNDPDTILVGDYHLLEQARVTATIVSLPGQLMFAGDKLAGLGEERMRMLQQALPVCDVHAMDLFPIFALRPVWDLKVSRPFGAWDVVALFNWGDQDELIGTELADLGLPADREYLAYEFWENEFKGTVSGRLETKVPARGVRLFAVHPCQGVPQFISTDRHITQGATSLLDQSWDNERLELRLALKLVPQYPTVLRIHVPGGYAVAEATSDNGDVESHQEGSLLNLGMLSEPGGESRVSIRFRRNG